MAVLVTGGAGYIGSHMVLALVDAGEQIVVLDDLSTGFRHAVHPKAKLVVGDVSDEKLVASLVKEHNIDAVIHFAAKIVVPDSVADPLGYYLANTVKTRALLAAVTGAGVKHFVFSSTAAVYGNPEENPVGEDAKLFPMSPYGRSKLISEWMLEDTAAACDFHYVALRYFNVAGADPEAAPGNPPMARRISSRSPARPPSANATACRCSAPTIRRPTAPACATTFTFPIWSRRILPRSGICARAARIS